ncbi:MAG: filamentous hemagglutinin N-terminal domain-containing protein [Opitutales bacterium]|nr:filamentous hemagglutinin N-terminal domain-containing protein [Opitutales bacterium]
MINNLYLNCFKAVRYGFGSLLLISFLNNYLSAQSGHLPQGGEIQNGNAVFNYSENRLDILQNTHQLITNWDSFNIGPDGAVIFNQPDSSSVALNRVIGELPSEIFGRLEANGNVFLVNPQGILFGESANVDVGGFLGTTLDIEDEAFLSGDYSFSRVGHSSGSIENRGVLRSKPGGFIGLISPEIMNEGEIISPEGSAALLAGDKVSVTLHGNSLISYRIEESAVDALIENRELIRVDGGLAVMSAKAVGEINRSVVNQRGVIEANSLQSVGGRIILTADEVNLESGSTTTAIGLTGGGLIEVGGSWQNSNAEVSQAVNTTVEEGALIDASAVENGNGGQIAIWSDVLNDESTTLVHGEVRATGGSRNGDGGRVETSGYFLDVMGMQLDATAANGNGGEWLLDPYDIEVNATGPTSGGTLPNFTSGSTSVILNTDINTQLNSNTSVTIQTGAAGGDSGDILIDADITKSAGGGDATLRFNAHRNIRLRGDTISSTSGRLNVYFNSDIDDNNDGAVAITNGGSVLTNGGYFYAMGGSSGTGFAYGNNAVFRGVNIIGTIETSGGDIILRGHGRSTGLGFGVDIGSESVIDAGGGNIVIRGRGNLNAGVNIEGDDATGGVPDTQIRTSGNGSINIEGDVVDNGANTDNVEDGVYIAPSEGDVGALIQTENGDITITGTGGNYSPGDINDGDPVAGVFVAGSLIQSTANGSISITGIGPSATGFDGGDRDGVALEFHTTVRTGNGTGGTGSITITGTAQGRGEGVDTEDILTGEIISGSGGVTITGTNDRGRGDGAELAGVINAIGGPISIMGTGGDGTNIGVFGGYGLDFENTTIGSTSTTSVSITGTALSGDSDGVGFHGFNSTDFVSVTTSSSGGITINGTGIGSFDGVYSNISPNTFTSGSGGITINGTGGTTGRGVVLYGTFDSTGGDISLTGTGGSGGGEGLAIGETNFFTNISGNISFKGTAQSNAEGVETEDGTVVWVKGSGDITIEGIGADDDDGIELDDTVLRTNTGNISLIGRSDTALAIDFTEDAVILESTGGGDISLKGDRMALSGTNNYLSSSGNLFVMPYSDTTSISVGSSGGVLQLPASYFDGAGQLFLDGFSEIVVGDVTNTGGITVDATTVVEDDLHLRQGSGSILLDQSLQLDTNNLSLTTMLSAIQSATGQFKANGLRLLGGGQFILDNSGNDVNTIAGVTGVLEFINQEDLEIGSVKGTDGISSDGTVEISTQEGDLRISENVVTTEDSSDAMFLNAARTRNALDPNGGDIVVIGNPTIGVGAGGRGILYTGSVSGSTQAASAVGFGSGRFRYSSDETTTNFTAPLSDGIYLIYRERPSVTINANDFTKVYDGLAFAGGAGVNNGTLLNGDSVSQFGGTLAYSGDSQGAVNAGTYTIGIGGLSDTLGYDLSFSNGTLIIDPATLIVTANDHTISYNGRPYSGGNGVTYSGFVNGENESVLTGTLTYGGSSQGSIDPGTYVLTTGGLSAQNYLITFVDGTLTIDKALLTITANDFSRTYDGTAFSGGNGVTYTGFVNGHDESILDGSLIYGGSSQGATNAGSYLIVPGGYSSKYYRFVYVDGTLTINQAPLTITALDDFKNYDGIPYSGGNGVVFDGFVNGEDPSVLNGSLIYLGDSQGSFLPGIYVITPSGYSAQNYAITYVDGMLSVLSPTDGGDVFNDNNPDEGGPTDDDGPTEGDDSQADSNLLIFGQDNFSSSTIQIVVYPPFGPPYTERGFKISGSDANIVLEPTNDSDKTFLPPSAPVDSISLTLGNAQYAVSTTSNGIIIHPENSSAAIQLEGQRLTVIRAAILELLRQQLIDLDALKSVYLDL